MPETGKQLWYPDAVDPEKLYSTLGGDLADEGDQSSGED